MNATYRQGRPLWFLLIVLLGWTGGRIALSQDWLDPIPYHQTLPLPAKPLPGMDTAKAAVARKKLAALDYQRSLSTPQTGQVRLIVYSQRETPPLAFSTDISSPAAEAPPPETVSSFASAPLTAENSVAGRWSLSSWLFWRHSGPKTALATVGQLGGSQFGARLSYQLVPAAQERLTIYARMTSAMRHPRAPEAAIGFSTQPLEKVALRFAVERRLALDHDARNAMAVMALGGFGPVGLIEDIVVEGYGQAGVVGVHSRDGFVDGKLTLLRPLLRRVPLSAGLGLSGGAQPHVARLDIGPRIETKVKLGSQPARIMAEWRQRIAGHARPGSGPAVTLAADF